ncbi:MAG: AbrB family transcriptional regulator [Alphaproteobacteria bacterium]
MPHKILKVAALVFLSIVLSSIMTWLGIPAAFLLGPLVSGIIIANYGHKISINAAAYNLAQGFTGCMIAQTVSSMQIENGSETNWWFFIVGALTVVALSTILGLVMMRTQILPGTTIAWGLSPGAATAMTIMADSYGADTQVVAFMQYLRVLLVATIASTASRIWGDNNYNHVASNVWVQTILWLPLLQTTAVVILCCLTAHFIKFRAGGLLLSLLAGIVLSRCGLITIELPKPLLAIAYAFIGWRIGLNFTPELLKHAVKALPRILFCTITLIGLCGLLAACLVFFWNIEPLTAYLATSPGGADTVAIIASSSKVDADFVMTMQILRFMFVLILSPFFAKIIANKNL